MAQRKRLVVKLRRTEHARLQEMAKAEGTSMSGLVRERLLGTRHIDGEGCEDCKRANS